MLDTSFSFLGSGDLYIDKLTSAGVAQGYQLVGNATSFQLSVEAEEKKQTGNKRDTYGQTIASNAKISATKISITLNQYDVPTMAAALMGDTVAMTASSGSVTAGSPEDVDAISDRWVELANYGGGVSSVVVKDETDTTTYVADTDYEVNTRLGMIKALSTGSISDGDTLHVAYDYAAEAGYKITGATESSVLLKLRLDGYNVNSGNNVQVTVWEAHVIPSTPIDFLSEDYGEITLEGEMITPTGYSWPFEII